MNKEELEKYVEILHKYVKNHKKDIFEFFFNEKESKVLVLYADAYDTDNCLEPDEKNYDEYFEMLFKPLNLETDKYIIVNYKNLPYKVLCNEELVYEKKM